MLYTPLTKKAMKIAYEAHKDVRDFVYDKLLELTKNKDCGHTG